jgi:hypothetical protein
MLSFSVRVLVLADQQLTSSEALRRRIVVFTPNVKAAEFSEASASRIATPRFSFPSLLVSARESGRPLILLYFWRSAGSGCAFS